jgi:hypothetical protein
MDGTPYSRTYCEQTVKLNHGSTSRVIFFFLRGIVVDVVGCEGFGGSGMVKELKVTVQG